MKGFSQVGADGRKPVQTGGPVPEAKEPVAYSPNGSMGGDVFGDDAGFQSVEPAGAQAEPSPDITDMSVRDEDEERVRRSDAQMDAAPRRQSSSAGSPGAARPLRPAVSQVVSKRANLKDVPMCRLPAVPKCLVDIAKRSFPAATRQDDAVAAYIFFREGMPADMEVPQEIADIAMSYTGEDVTVETVKDIVERDMLDIKAQNRMLLRKLDTLELALAYMVFEKAGFVREAPMSPDSVRFLEKGINDLIAKLEADGETLRVRRSRQQGRPIR